MNQLVQLNKAYPEIQKQGGELLAIHLECAAKGSKIAKEKSRLLFHVANDERLQVATTYSPTSTYLVGLDGKIKARWLGRVHDRVLGDELLEAMKQ
jgi:peroxiredoxin